MENVRNWNYKEIKKIGRGGYGEVYKCRNLITGQLVAIKMITIRNEIEGVPSYTLREVSLLKELQHENVVRNLVFLVFECLDLDLHSFITKMVLDPPVIRAMLKQILLCLAYCHSLNVLRRDLKPNNLLIDLKSSTVKISDFGLARLVRVPQKEYSRDKMLCSNPKERITANDALEHKYLRGVKKPPSVFYPSSGNFLNCLERSTAMSDIIEWKRYALGKRLLKQDL
ncbi:Protein kinase domain [Melia azedarach]|uniref:Protein kinase domain n=1 Tax=Melia azedarach TaxID=155640 RepID=A0ACC1Y5L3_MELAZ|nr:Protein kinase domain [Melia azedarach]